MFDRARIGRAIRAIRLRKGWRQQDLAIRSGVSRSLISNVECGHLGVADFAKLERICLALGADLDVRVRWQGEGLDRLLDEGHAAIVQRVVTLLGVHAWRTWLEATFSIYGERGSIDVLGWHDATRTLPIVEVKSIIADAQGTLAPLDRKVRLGARIARERGLDAAVVARLLVIADHAVNRRRAARFDALFAAALPDRRATVRQWLAKPAGPLAGLIFLSDSTQSGIRRQRVGRCRVNPSRGSRKSVG